ncbi:hypothetical protein QN277_022097 [Acacia crassicarpa]|uniref:Uncharacterized protein n=1 Tax=Acacia crassicarpa TaxID=499986 RepID=A0AAE1MIE1_9FABA|nr:hypothetical protein QN277_022097 [Acacia crassicarpa]
MTSSPSGIFIELSRPSISLAHRLLTWSFPGCSLACFKKHKEIPHIKPTLSKLKTGLRSSPPPPSPAFSGVWSSRLTSLSLSLGKSRTKGEETILS